MGKINILLIDDNPFCSIKDLPANQRERRYLARFLNCEEEELNQITVRHLGFPVFDLGSDWQYDNFHDYFEIKWLYSTSTLKEYIDLLNALEQSHSLSSLASLIFLPDIVVFDYALTGNQISHNDLPKSYSLDFIRTSLDPIYRNKSQTLQLKKEPNYAWSGQGNADRYGLFAGGVIVERFRRNKPCFGVPATYWKSNDLRGQEPGFFEWFLSTSFRGVFDEDGLKGKTEQYKSWREIINASLPEYRDEILEYIANGKVTVNLHELIDILGYFENSESLMALEKMSITLVSPYGAQCMPLYGLFIDCWDSDEGVEVEHVRSGNSPGERKTAIWLFINQILELLTNGLDGNELSAIMEGVHLLLKKFDSPEFTDRIMLSDLFFKMKDGLLEQQEEKILEGFIREFGIDLKKEKITQKEPFSINSLNIKSDSKRLLLYCLCLELWKRYTNFKNSLLDEEANYEDYREQPQEAILPPDLIDLLLSLFPFNSHVILFAQNGGLDKKFQDFVYKSIKRNLGINISDLNYNIGVDPRPVMRGIGDFYFCRAYAQGISLTEYPYWLQSYSYGESSG